MHGDDDVLARWRHDHRYLGETHGRNEVRTRIVLGLTVVMMVAEIVAGTRYKSMALLADGWHMGSHAAALGLASLAYVFARRHVSDEAFSFGTGKMGDLGGYTSALILGVIAVSIGWESLSRLYAPVSIAYDDALVVAVIGLIVNLVSAWILGGGGAAHHEHAHEHTHDHGGHHQDHNFRAVYMHVLADALTSVFAIAALLCGRMFGWTWLDAAVGLMGAVIIARWAWSLMVNAGRMLLDAEPVAGVTTAVRNAIETEHDNRVADLHVWRLGPGHLAAMLTVVSRQPRPPAHYKALLAHIPGLSHVTVEVETNDAQSH